MKVTPKQAKLILDDDAEYLTPLHKALKALVRSLKKLERGGA